METCCSACGPPSADASLVRSEAVNAGYSYLVAKLGPFAVTRRSLRLGVSAFALTVVSLQGASLCLVTSTAEELGNAIRWALSPLRWVG